MNPSYLLKPATKWVSKFVLLGCVLITLFLVYAASKASALGERFTIEKYEITEDSIPE